ncbi:hypothetical protein [Pedobacter aquatilis]|uniref:hypothetical protein n=1 Tax=Pedobacter aquatilis TaxID=351343 RepID=UPI002930CAB7|nr:hypothetical protein [Pedobacter aquatilis]
MESSCSGKLVRLGPALQSGLGGADRNAINGFGAMQIGKCSKNIKGKGKSFNKIFRSTTILGF